MNTVQYKDIFGCTATLESGENNMILSIYNPYHQLWFRAAYTSRRRAEIDLNSRWPGLWCIISE